MKELKHAKRAPKRLDNYNDVFINIKELVQTLINNQWAKKVKMQLTDLQSKHERYDEIYKRISNNLIQVNQMLKLSCEDFSCVNQFYQQLSADIDTDLKNVEDLINDDDNILKQISEKMKRIENYGYWMWMIAFVNLTVMFLVGLFYFWFSPSICFTLLIHYLGILTWMAYKCGTLYMLNADLMDKWKRELFRFERQEKRLLSYISENEQHKADADIMVIRSRKNN